MNVKLSNLAKYIDTAVTASHNPAMQHSIDAAFAALSDPTRRAVVERLARGPASVSDLAAPHNIALPTFMRHLKVLENSGLVRSAKKGRVRTCHIEPAPLMELQGWLEWQRRVWDNRLDQLSALADDINRNSS